MAPLRASGARRGAKNGGNRRRTRAAAVVLAVGVGLVAAPAVFQMFTRAPRGGDMIDDFRPFMTQRKVDTFRGYLNVIGAADTEADSRLRPEVQRRLGIDDSEYDRRYPAVADFHDRWPGVDADMGDMLDTMEESLDNYEAVDALPPFAMFPWFFVVPGVLAATLGAALLARSRRGRPGGWVRSALVVLGVGLVAAPLVFQMFTRAPKGAEMIDDFRPLMQQEKVTRVQGYFLVIGAAEGALRNDVVPVARDAADAPSLPGLERFFADWPRISNEMAPMIGAMSDNVAAFAGIDALPPFTLFPWFFVLPGLLVAGFAFAAGRPDETAPPATPAGTPADTAAIPS